jgi:hypothetical protein
VGASAARRAGAAGIAAGDVVFFDFQTGDVHPVDHVGIVESVNADGSFNTIEGNTSNQVMRHRRNACKGYGRPAWTSTLPTHEDTIMDAEIRAEFDALKKRLDQDHLPIAKDTNTWVKVKAGQVDAAVLADAIVDDLGKDFAAAVADVLSKRLAS